MSDYFIGQVFLLPFNFPPKGFAFCDGQLLPIAQNTALFSLLGTTYGGDGKVTFALPDLRARVPLGFGQGPGLTNYNLGEAAGAENVALIVSQLPPHAHGLNVVVIRPGWVPRDPAHAAELAASVHGKDSYLSPGDAGRGFAAAVEAEGLPRYTVVHVTSRPVGAARYELGAARALLGYEPRDRWPEGLELEIEDAVGGTPP